MPAILKSGSLPAVCAYYGPQGDRVTYKRIKKEDPVSESGIERRKSAPGVTKDKVLEFFKQKPIWLSAELTEVAGKAIGISAAGAVSNLCCRDKKLRRFMLDGRLHVCLKGTPLPEGAQDLGFKQVKKSHKVERTKKDESRADALISISYGNGKDLLLDLDEAAQIWAKLDRFKGVFP